jgi:transketolase
MRVDFTKAVMGALQNDGQSVFITGDLGYNALEPIQRELGKRFVNAGVAEQNMMGMAAGMALAGSRPWVYSIIPFTTFRCLEQIRNDVCLHHLPVRIVGNGGGYTYGIMGSTHHALEDLAVLKCLPNMTLFFPQTGDQVAAAVKQMDELHAPSYLRLSISAHNAPIAPLHENPKTLTRQYKRGAKLTIIGVGHATQIVLAALAKHGLDAVDADVFGVSKYPFDLNEDRELASSVTRNRRVIVIDEHYLAGSIAESLKMVLPPAESFDVLCAVYRQDQKYGSPAFHVKQSGMTPDDLVKLAQQRTA